MIHDIGFTGTRRGMTDRQSAIVDTQMRFLHRCGAVWLHHGGAEGADDEAHNLWRTGCRGQIHLHPGRDGGGRVTLARDFRPDRVSEPAPYLDRNKDIVTASSILLAAPGEAVEILRSGTWATVRDARRRRRVILLCLPDGSMIEEGGPVQMGLHI